LDVKLALEEKVFGWTHLTAAFWGHSIFTLGAYWLVYELVTLCFWQLLSLLSSDTATATTIMPNYVTYFQMALSLLDAIATYHMV
jgi:hypothetical protein